MDIKMNFGSDFSGKMECENGIFEIGNHGLYPYDMIGGALASCIHATFRDILRKKRITLEACEYHVVGEKREQVPTHLAKTHLDVVVTNPSKSEGLKEAFELALKYCSVYFTISQVSEMTHTFTIVEK